MMYRLCLLALVWAAPLVAQTATPAVPAAASTAPADLEALSKTTKLHVARSGDEVVLAWEFPAGAQIRGLDIYRTISVQPKNRTRIDYARPEPALFIDKVPDPSVTYWYWLKVALPTGEHFNVGPVKTADATVWTP